MAKKAGKIYGTERDPSMKSSSVMINNNITSTGSGGSGGSSSSSALNNQNNTNTNTKSTNGNQRLLLRSRSFVEPDRIQENIGKVKCKDT